MVIFSRSSPWWGRPAARVRLLGFIVAALFVTSPVVRAEFIDRQVRREPIAQGAELITIRQFDEKGWLNIYIVETDHRFPHLQLDALLGHEQLTRPETLSDMARRRGPVAAVNGDFFYIRGTNAPLGVHLQSGELFKSPAPGREAAVGFLAPFSETAAGQLFLGEVTFDGSVVSEVGARHALAGWNVPAPARDQIILFNRRWGPTAQGANSPDLAGRTGLAHAVGVDGVITIYEENASGVEIPENGFVLLGDGAGAAWLRSHAQPGSRLAIDTRVAPPGLHTAIGGGPFLLLGGVVPPDLATEIHPRTAIGFNADRTRSWLVLVDGRSALSRGVSLPELAGLLREFGAHDALNLDGGGSSSLVARTPGNSGPVVQNLPSDGRERPIPNGIGLFSTAPPALLDRLTILQPPADHPYSIVPGEIRLPPGATYVPGIAATDAHINPLPPPSELRWEVLPNELGTFDDAGKFTATAPGRGFLRVSTLAETGEILFATAPLRIIGPPRFIEMDPPTVTVSPGEEVRLQVRAVDGEGFRAQIHPGDLEWGQDGDSGLLDGGGLFRGGNTPASGRITARFGDLNVSATVSVGERSRSITTFENGETWSTHTVPAEIGSRIQKTATPPHVRIDRPALRLDYDFRGPTRTRAAYLTPARGQWPIEGRPLRLGLWAYGDGNDGWLRSLVVDAADVRHTLDLARRIDWTGWRFIEATLPEGTVYPISLRSIYVVETRPDAQYRGTLAFDELVAVFPADSAPAEARPALPDPWEGPVGRRFAEKELRFALLPPPISGDEPEREREFAALVNRDELDFVIIAGKASADEEDAVAKGVDGFRRHLDAPVYLFHTNDGHFTFRHGGADFIFLDTSDPAGLRVSNAAQWPWFKEILAASTGAALFVVSHSAPAREGAEATWRDPSEALLFQRLLSAEFDRRRKVFVLHQDQPGRVLHEGVRYLSAEPTVYILFTVANGEVRYEFRDAGRREP